MRDGFPELRTSRAVPGVDGIERLQRRTLGIGDADELDAGIRDGTGAVGKSDQREGHARSPDFRVFGSGGLERGEREDHVADRAGTDQETAHDLT